MSEIAKKDFLMKIYDAFDAVARKDYTLALQICNEVIVGRSDELVKRHASKLLDYVRRTDNLDHFIESLKKTESRVILNADIYASVSELIFHNNVEFAEAFINAIVERGLVHKDEVSIGTVRKTLHSAKNVIRSIDKNLAAGGLQKVFLKERLTIGTVGAITDISGNWGTYDYYENYPTSKSINTFETDFASESKAKTSVLRSKGFSVNIPTDSLNRIYYGEDVRICTLEADMYAIYDKNLTYTRSASGRLAKIIPMNISAAPSRRIPKAIFLPVPHAIDNYYHILAEMVYPLRYAAFVESDVPIVYSEDRLNVLPFFAERLNINMNRFVSFEQIKDCSVDQALIIDKGSHFWGVDFYNFFNWSINNGRACSRPGSMIYISRSKSSRGFQGELELEKFLVGRGVKILHAQEMSILEQIRAFESASLVIAPHGAGLANILFSDRRVKLLEIFNKNFIHPDFYLRSRQLGIRYAAFILEESNSISIEEFEDVFDKLVSV